MSKEKKPTPPASGGGALPSGSTTASCPCPTKVVFKEEVDGINIADKYKYGWDDYTDAALPWKSVEKGQNDTIQTEITPAANASRAEFVSSDVAKVTVSPATASSDKQVVTVAGVEKGETEIKSKCSGAELGKVRVATYVKKTKTIAVRLVHEKNYTSTDVSDADIRKWLRKVYKQAVFEFTVTRLAAKTVEFDKNGDGKIDVDTWMSDEMKAVRDACKDDSYDYNLFIVDKPSDGSFGFMDYNQRYGFIHPDTPSVTIMNTFPHELGHGAFGLVHQQTDANNVMAQGEGDHLWLLRKDQWDKINP